MTGKVTLDALVAKAPLERMRLAPTVRMASTTTTESQKQRASNLFWQKLSFAWYGKDPLALAYCELIYAWHKYATRHRCHLCDGVFLRPKSVFGTLCPVCRRLHWRQRSWSRTRPPEERQRQAIRLYMERLGRPGLEAAKEVR